MATDDERKAALHAFDGTGEGRAALERRVRPLAMLAQDSKLIGVAISCLYALMQVEPAERRLVLDWLLSQSE